MNKQQSTSMKEKQINKLELIKTANFGITKDPSENDV